MSNGDRAPSNCLVVGEQGWRIADQTPDQTKTRWSPSGSFRARSVEATTGFEPVNRGFADLRVEPLHHVARIAGCRIGLAAPRGFEPRFTDPKSAVLPLDEGAAVREGEEIGAEDGTRTRDPHLGKVMLYQLSHFRSELPDHLRCGAESQNSNWRHRDFQSRALPTELSRPDGQPACRLSVGGAGGYHGPRGAKQTPRPLAARPTPGRSGCADFVRGRAAPRRSAARSRLIRSRIGGWVDIRPDERCLELLDRVGEVQVLGARGWRPRGPPGRRRSWPAPARARTGCGSARPPTRRRGTRAGGSRRAG